ncbi:MAG: hypothetical protein ACI8Y4_001718 [Candidatus Poriferisodalaceae bacterium]|jgi:hypothetical protein
MTTVSREEIADSLAGAFEAPPVTGADLVNHAEEDGARKPVLLVLGRLEGLNYRTLRDIWGELHDVPVEA